MADLAFDVLLLFDSVKMAAAVALNGHTLGVVADQFLRYNFSVWINQPTLHAFYVWEGLPAVKEEALCKKKNTLI